MHREVHAVDIVHEENLPTVRRPGCHPETSAPIHHSRIRAVAPLDDQSARDAGPCSVSGSFPGSVTLPRNTVSGRRDDGVSLQKVLPPGIAHASATAPAVESTDYHLPGGEVREPLAVRGPANARRSTAPRDLQLDSSARRPGDRRRHANEGDRQPPRRPRGERQHRSVGRERRTDVPRPAVASTSDEDGFIAHSNHEHVTSTAVQRQVQNRRIRDPVAVPHDSRIASSLHRPRQWKRPRRRAQGARSMLYVFALIGASIPHSNLRAQPRASREER